MTWLSDNPIESHLDDKLNFSNAATILKNLIAQSDTPISIGINGKWGSGKTSLMRLIKEKLKEDDKYRILTSWFDTWNYANEKEIWRVLMISLIDDLDPENRNSFDIEKLISSILDIGFITSNAWLSQGVSLLSDKDNLKETINNIFRIKKPREENIVRDQIRTVKAFREDFEKIVKNNVGDKGKFVIFIDDLDRIMPEKVVDVIEAIKTFLTCKRCVFIIGCDYDYLNKCIEQRYTGMDLSGKDYIEKIVQIPFNVPSLEGSIFSVFLSSNLEAYFTKEEFITAVDLITISIGRNPRRVKRLLNLHNIVCNLNTGDELDSIVLFKLLCFMVRWPDLYRKFVEARYKRENKFIEYENWALPKESFEEYAGLDTYEPDPEQNIEYESQIEYEQAKYEKYEEEMDLSKTNVDKELHDNQKNSDEDLLRAFFSRSPRLPRDNKVLGQYLALIETMDIYKVENIEKRLLEAMPSIYEVDELVVKVTAYFNGQKVEGKYFNISEDVILPVKSTDKKDKIILKSQRKTKIGNWKINIIKYKNFQNDGNFFKNIDNILAQNKEYKILWIVSPWKFAKSAIDFANKKGNVYLTDAPLLKELLSKLKGTDSVLYSNYKQ